jgi:1-acyl-sn-glycerol-3-phosphate acyltransferase
VTSAAKTRTRKSAVTKALLRTAGRQSLARRPGGEVRAQVLSLERELAETRRELEWARRERIAGEGLSVALVRLAQGGLRGLTLENLGRLQAALYFAWHSGETDEFGRDAVFAETLRPFFEFLYGVWWRVDASGIEHIPAQGPALVVANHSGVLPYDGAMVKLAIQHHHPARRDCRMLILDMFALLPFLAPALMKYGGVRAHPDNAERLLGKGNLVGVFPEGVKGVGKHFAERYKLARFGRGGFVRIALRTGAPIIPCAVVGAEEIHPILARADWAGRLFGLPYFPLTPTFPWLGPLGLIPLPTKWSIDFADPMPMDDYGPDAAEDPILVNRLSQEVREAVQKMIDGRLARRRSVWFG